MSKSKLLWTLACGTSLVVLTEICHYILNCYKKRSEHDLLASKVLCEVLWTNELSDKCIMEHQKMPYSYNIKSIVPTKYYDHKLCPNRFCSFRKLYRIVEIIDSAQFSVDIAMYMFSSVELSYALKRAVKRGVIVRVVLDKDTLQGHRSKYESLLDCGIAVRVNTGSYLMHHKFCLVDSAARIASLYKEHNLILEHEYPPGSLLTGSLNWTVQGIFHNWENIVIIYSKEIVNLYTKEFERIWLALASNTNNNIKKKNFQKFDEEEEW